MNLLEKQKPIILIVDDNKSNIDILINILDKEYDIIPTTNGKIAIDITKVEKVDLILLDIMMPIIDGFEVCKKIKQNPKTSNIPILFLTAKEEDQDIQKGFELGAVDYITKPFNPTELLIRVTNHIELASYKNNLEIKIKEEIQKTKETEILMIQQSKLAEMGELINMIAHQWRQPLGAINSATIAIDFTIKSGKYNLNNKNEQDALLKFINDKHKRIFNGIEFLTNTIDDFRNFYKQDKSKELISINLPIIKALNIIDILIKNKGIKISTEFQTDEKVSIYQNELMQVILNILKNSEDNFLLNNTQNPKINILTKKEDDKYIISISDNGGGISDTIIDKIFNPYFSTKYDKNGTGLGLYMSKIIICNHLNGNIEVENIRDDKDYLGVKFKIILPK